MLCLQAHTFVMWIMIAHLSLEGMQTVMYEVGRSLIASPKVLIKFKYFPTLMGKKKRVIQCRLDLQFPLYSEAEPFDV